jgi:hypothetical protein
MSPHTSTPGPMSMAYVECLLERPEPLSNVLFSHVVNRRKSVQGRGDCVWEPWSHVGRAAVDHRAEVVERKMCRGSGRGRERRCVERAWCRRGHAARLRWGCAGWGRVVWVKQLLGTV